MLPVVLLIAGLTGTARLLREAHSAGEVYAGYLAGAICQLAGWYIAG
jgi:peptidase E